MKRKIFLISLTVLLWMVSTRTGHAAPYYQGQTIKLIVTTKPGGGFDFYGRLAAQYMAKYMPGSTFIVKNIPGAGHILGCNMLYVSKPDGLTIGTFERALIVAQIAGIKGVKYDLHKMSWLGSPSSDPRVLAVNRHTPFQTLDEIVKSENPVRFASAGIGTTAHMDALLAGKILGAKNWKIVTGYGGAETQMALMRGECDASFMSLSTAMPFIQDGSYRILLMNSKKPIKGYENIPYLSKLAADRYKPLVDLGLFMVELNRPFAGPPGIPADRLKILEDAFEKTWKDPELLAMTRKMDRPINYIDGKEAKEMLASFSRMDPDLVAVLKEAYGVK